MVAGRKSAQQPWWKQLSWNRPCTAEQVVRPRRLLTSSSRARLPRVASQTCTSKRHARGGRASGQESRAHLLPTVPVTISDALEAVEDLSYPYRERGAVNEQPACVDRGTQCGGNFNVEADYALPQYLLDYLDEGSVKTKPRKLPSLEASVAASLGKGPPKLPPATVSSRCATPLSSRPASRMRNDTLPPLQGSHTPNLCIQVLKDGAVVNYQVDDVDVEILESEKCPEDLNNKGLAPPEVPRERNSPPIRDKFRTPPLESPPLKEAKGISLHIPRSSTRPQSALATTTRSGLLDRDRSRDSFRPRSSHSCHPTPMMQLSHKQNQRGTSPKSNTRRHPPKRHVTLKEFPELQESGLESDEEELQEEPIQRLRARSFSKFQLLQRRSTKDSYASSFDKLVQMMRRHNYTLEEIHIMRDDFNAFDSSGEGILTSDEFLQLVRKRCGLTETEEMPKHLVDPQWLQNCYAYNGTPIDFEAYLMWSMTHAYAEEMMVPDAIERHLRRVARDNNLLLPDVEKVKGVFDGFDEDKSQHIDEAEFEKVIYVLMNARNTSDISAQMLKRFWREVDCDGSGEISFEEFLLWYFKFIQNK